MSTPIQSAVDRLRAAFDEEPPRNKRRLRSLAETYKPDEQYEEILRIRQEDPALFRTLVTPSMRMALGSYEAAKAAYEEVNK